MSSSGLKSAGDDDQVGRLLFSEVFNEDFGLVPVLAPTSAQRSEFN